jgi:hypothetical protein
MTSVTASIPYRNSPFSHLHDVALLTLISFPLSYNSYMLGSPDGHILTLP